MSRELLMLVPFGYDCIDPGVDSLAEVVLWRSHYHFFVMFVDVRFCERRLPRSRVSLFVG